MDSMGHTALSIVKLLNSTLNATMNASASTPPPVHHANFVWDEDNTRKWNVLDDSEDEDLPVR